MEFFCITDPESSLGFKLAGVRTHEVSSRPEALTALKVASAAENMGVILVTQKAASFISAELEELTYSKHLPLILEIPSRGEERKKKSVQEVMKKAIGISI